MMSSVVETSLAVAATSKRSEKTELLAVLLREAEPADIGPLVGFLTGDVHQGRIGVGWASVGSIEVTPADTATLTVGDVDTAISELADITGAGSQDDRRRRLEALFTLATEAEADFVTRLFLGDIRQGANHGVMAEAVAKAAGLRAAVVRRAQMLAGDLAAVAVVAMTEGQPGVEAIGLQVLQAIQPMLASTATDVDDAMGSIDAMASVEWKLDGIRIQVHRDGPKVRVFTRNLNDVTARLADVVDLVSGFDAESFVLDGEIIGVSVPDPENLPESEAEHGVVFQDTMSRFGRDEAPDGRSLRPHFFDLLHRDGVDLVDLPLTERRRQLSEVAGPHVIPGVFTDDPQTASGVLEEALAAGHEGVMVKAASSSYEAGRRGKSWRKVKPVITLDLIVLGAEWGHGRRTGRLSNLHLGARDPSGGPAVMVGKTFKGLTDALLAWQTEALLAREVSRKGIAVFVDQDLVIEIAIDGVQASTRYPGGVALRFARVRGYREDKAPAEADSIEFVRSLLNGRPAVSG